MGRRGPRHGGGGHRGGGQLGRGGGGGRFEGRYEGRFDHRFDSRFDGGSRPEGPSRGSTETPQSPDRVVVSVAEEHPPARGPHPGYVSVACQFTSEQQLRRMQRDNGCDPSREDSYRLQGVQLIDNVRESLQLPVKTFTTACTFYHRFRLNFRDAEYNFQDAALSALFVACKVEDTLKKSRDVLCAAYNLKNPDNTTTPDDKIFDRPSTIIVGLDRLILQTVGFDFRVRHPQKLLVKVIRRLLLGGDGGSESRDTRADDTGPSRGDSDETKEFLAIAYPMSIDLYKTFAPIKQTSFTMVLAIVELTARILDRHVAAVQALDLAAYHTNRGCVVETLLDLLDLYAQFPKMTKIGRRVDLNRFIDIKIRINQEVDETPELHRTETWCDRCAADERDSTQQPITPGSATSPATAGSKVPFGSASGSGSGGSGSGSGNGNGNGIGIGIGIGNGNGKPNLHKRQEGTMRFLFESDRMRDEQAEVAEYFREDYQEETIEVEKPIAVVEERQSQADQGHQGHGTGGGYNNGGGGNFHSSHHNNSRRRDRGGHHHAGGIGGGGAGNESGWGPYQRNNRNHESRHKPKKGGFY